jgi:hypothetical protein
MKKGGKSSRTGPAWKSANTPRRVRLPGFITGDEVGLGDMIKRTTAYLGIQACGGCDRRATALNRWLVFTNRRSN